MRTLLSVALGLVVATAAARAQEVYVDNVVIVLDASGSMKGNMRRTSTPKIDAARSALKEVMKTIPQSTHVGLLVFGGQKNGWVHPLGPRDDAKLIAAIDSIWPEGGTPLGAYMKTGADRLLKAREEQYGYGSYRLLIVTDGEAGDKDLVERYTPDIVSRGIIVDAVGVDMAKAHTLATQVHSYRSANDPAALQQAIQAVFAEVGGADAGSADGDDAFEDLAGLSNDAAMALINALVSSGNQPIGGTAVTPAATDAGQPARPAPQTRAKPRRSGQGWIIAVVIVTIVVLKVVRGGRRR
jgi:uncharacterized protein YegL